MTTTDGPQHARTDTVVETSPPTVAVHDTPAFGQPAATTHARQVQTTSASRFAPDAVITAFVGLGWLLLGLIVVIRGGFDSPMSEPVVRVLGYTHTTSLGLIEIGIGTGLLISGASRSRSGGMFFGSVLGIVGFVGAVQAESFQKFLALESGLGWLAVATGIVVVAAVVLLPRFAKNSTTITQN